jgi:hypothetical protein
MAVALLLADPSPCLRWLALTQLLGKGDDDQEVAELAVRRGRDPLVRSLCELQDGSGSWKETDLGYPSQRGSIRATSHALMRLGYLGFGAEDEVVRRGAEHLFGLQGEDGAWPLESLGRGTADGQVGDGEGYSMIPMQTAVPLRALAMCGYAEDPRGEKAYEWLLRHRLEDGSWPTGVAAGAYGGVAEYRRLPHSRWGCRTSTTGALVCWAWHPERRHGPVAYRSLDLLLGTETRERGPLGLEVARLTGAEEARGTFTYFAAFDLALLLDLCWRIGASEDDSRVADVMQTVLEWRNPCRLWEYRRRPQVTRWVSFDLMRSLSRLGCHEDWVSLEPRTPFRPSQRRRRRY